MTALVLRLSDPSALLPDVAGTKMATLARLHGRGFRVPPGFVITTALVAAGDRWRDEVAAAYGDLGSPPVAVRSSATDEDLPGRSAAGMYRTVLDVQGTAAVLVAVEECVASADSGHRVAYAAGTAGGLAIGVMEMVRPSVSGVAFSADPLGSGHLVIEAVRGPLEPLVSGRVVPHHLALDEAGTLVVEEAGEDGTEVLDPQTVASVARLTREVAAELGGEVDVEWALDAGGLVVLQARPALVHR